MASRSQLRTIGWQMKPIEPGREADRTSPGRTLTISPLTVTITRLGA